MIFELSRYLLCFLIDQYPVGGVYIVADEFVVVIVEVKTHLLLVIDWLPCIFVNVYACVRGWADDSEITNSYTSVRPSQQIFKIVQDFASGTVL